VAWVYLAFSAWAATRRKLNTRVAPRNGVQVPALRPVVDATAAMSAIANALLKAKARNWSGTSVVFQNGIDGEKARTRPG
jgi:hypothetical protein